MKVYARFAYYLAGFMIGIFFLMLILNGKESGCSYFPNARVLKDLRSKPFYYSEKTKTILTQKWVDTADIRKTLTYGKVNFDKSNTKRKGGKVYFVEGKNAKNEPITLEVVNFSDKVYLENIVK